MHASGPRLGFVFAAGAARFDDGRFRVTTEAQLRTFARFVFTDRWQLSAWGVGTTSVDSPGPPTIPRAEPGLHHLNSWTVNCLVLSR